MGQHRGEGGIRGVSKGPVIVVALVVVLIAGVIGWFQLGERIDSQGAQAAGACVEGEAVLHVTTDPDIAPTVKNLANQYSDSDPVVRDHCVRVEVTAAPSKAVAAALAADAGAPWDETALGVRPDLWIPDGSWAIESIGRPGVVTGEPRSIASSPIVLAVPRDVSAALSETPAAWQDLPALQSVPTSLEDRGLPGWGNLRLALPIGADSAATGMTAQAVAAAVAGNPTGPITTEQAASGPVRAALTDLSRGAPERESTEATTADALSEMVGQADDGDATVHAVPTTEQQVYSTLREDPRARVTAFHPAGATPVADHPAAIVSGSDETLARASSELVEFLRAPERARVFADAGFRVPGATPPTDTSLDFTEVDAPLAPADPAAAAVVDRVILSPVPDRATTVLLDESRSMSSNEGAATRLANTTAALADRIRTTPDTSNIGLWEYSSDLGERTPYRITVPTGPLGADARRTALTDALEAARPASGSWTYASLAAAYADAVENYVPGRTNSILLITDGADDQESSTRAALLAAIDEASTRAAPVEIDVITIGENSGIDTLRAVAERTGGTVRTVDSSEGPALADTISELTSS